MHTPESGVEHQVNDVMWEGQDRYGRRMTEDEVTLESPPSRVDTSPVRTQRRCK